MTKEPKINTCKFATIYAEWGDGDADIICTNAKCDMCTYFITEYDCKGCNSYIKEIMEVD